MQRPGDAEPPHGSPETCQHRPKSSFRGVEWDDQLGKWRARITMYAKKMSLGSFACEVDAARLGPHAVPRGIEIEIHRSNGSACIPIAVQSKISWY
jgi:hypothetical protein